LVIIGGLILIILTKVVATWYTVSIKVPLHGL